MSVGAVAHPTPHTPHTRTRAFTTPIRVQDPVHDLPPPPYRSTALQVMNSTQFPCGMHYFEMTRRMFAFEHPCAECVAVHNNWLVGTDAKMYR